jgi:predicted ArsR family transcriptional regulator
MFSTKSDDMFHALLGQLRQDIQETLVKNMLADAEKQIRASVAEAMKSWQARVETSDNHRELKTDIHLTIDGLSESLKPKDQRNG